MFFSKQKKIAALLNKTAALESQNAVLAKKLSDKELAQENALTKIGYLELKVRKLTNEIELRNNSVKFSAAVDESYYVNLRKHNSESAYRLSADLTVQTLQSAELTPKGISSVKNTNIIYFLKYVYWNNGGFISFAETMPTVEFDKELVVADDKGVLYHVSLTHDKVDVDKSLLFSQDRIKRKTKAYCNKAIAEINKILSDKEINYPYLATIISDYKMHLNETYVYDLIHKARPALTTAEKLKSVNKQLRAVEKKYRLYKYRQSIYEDAFPWFADVSDITTDEIESAIESEKSSDNEYDTLKNYLSHTEYTTLATAERYQLALDRYKKKSKTNWQIGIAFERYIGYLYETKGYSVEYYGANKKLEDLGRDLIVKKGSETIIIQCKYWNSHKTIHEKHIFQLYGTMIAYYSEQGNSKQKLFNGLPPQIKGMLITSCSLSDTARKYAAMLNIEIREEHKFTFDYPCIKCNISRRDGEKIYHLPFDQQYDNIKIEHRHGEFYANTVAEAEAAGFRRAWRWHSQDN